MTTRRAATAAPRILGPHDRKVTAWRNGGGETAEIAVHPAGATIDDFGWRLSMARVASDGPFSPFPGVDRTLTVIEGGVLRLSLGDRPAVELRAGSEPFAFPGDLATRATLPGAPVTDLNVMTRRGAWRHAVRVLRIEGASVIDLAADTTVLFCLGDGLRVAPGGTPARLDRHWACVLEGRGGRVGVQASRPCALLVANLWLERNHGEGTSVVNPG